MDKQHFTVQTERLWNYFGREVPHKGTFAEWWTEFSSLIDGAYTDAVTEATRTRKSLPTLQEFKQIVARHDPRKRGHVRQRTGRVEFDGDRKDLEFMAWAVGATMRMIETRSKEERRRRAVKLLADGRGHAMRLGIVDRIDWQAMAQALGVELPSAWRNISIEPGPDSMQDPGSSHE